MAGTNIPSTPADGKIRTVLIPTLADPSAPTVTELNAGTAIDISCYLTPGGFAFSIDQATITDERECDTITRTAPGRKTPTLTITGIDNTNATDGATPAVALPNALAETLDEGTRLYAVRRRGVAHDATFAAAEVVSVVGFAVGVRTEVAAEANGVLKSTWNAFVDEVYPAAVVVAGS